MFVFLVHSVSVPCAITWNLIVQNVSFIQTPIRCDLCRTRTIQECVTFQPAEISIAHSAVSITLTSIVAFVDYLYWSKLLFLMIGSFTERLAEHLYHMCCQVCLLHFVICDNCEYKIISILTPLGCRVLIGHLHFSENV